MSQNNVLSRTGAKSRSVYRRVTVVGLLIVAACLVVLFALTLSEGTFEPLIIIFGVPNLIFAWLVWRFGKWTLLIAAVWAVLNLVLNGPFIFPNLKYVRSFFDFGISVPIIVGLFLTLMGGIFGFLQERKATPRSVVTSGERAFFLATGVAVVGLMVLSGTLNLTSRKTVSEQARAGATQLAMKNTKFVPDVIQVNGRLVRIVVKNNDPIVHTFTVDELGINKPVLGGSEELFEFTLPRTGEFTYHCAITGHEDMKGKLTTQ